MERIKIAILAPKKPSEGYGGAEQHLSDLANIFESFGFDVDFFSVQDAELPKFFFALAKKIFNPINSVAASFVLNKKIADKGYNLVFSVELLGCCVSHHKHIHLFFGSYVGFRRFAVKASGNKLAKLIIDHAYKMLETKTTGNFGAVANSIWLRDVLRNKNIPVSEDVILPPINTKNFGAYSKMIAREILGIGRDEMVIMYAGRYEYAKGCDRLKRIIKKAPDNWRFLVLCPDAFYDDINNMSNVKIKIGVENSKMNLYYTAADVLVQPSRFEGYSLVTGEAQLCGCPVVMSNVGQAQNIIMYGDFYTSLGVINNPDSTDEWIEKIQYYLENISIASESAKTYARKNLSFEVVGLSWRNFFIKNGVL